MISISRLLILTIFVTTFIFNALHLNAQTDNPVITALERRFGSVMIRDLEGFHEFTLSAPFKEIENLLNTVISQEWYPTHISISGRPDEKAAIILRAKAVKNDSPKYFSALQQLLMPGILPWKTEELNDSIPAVTAVETDFSAKVTILGQTLKSGLIFSHLFPMIERVPTISAPFFEHGSYKDTPSGRVMDFTIKCNW
jgi:hypothetical protein